MKKIMLILMACILGMQSCENSNELQVIFPFNAPPIFRIDPFSD